MRVRLMSRRRRAGQVPAETLGQGLCYSLVKVTGETALIQVRIPESCLLYSVVSQPPLLQALPRFL
jgi:hypothetical protein